MPQDPSPAAGRFASTAAEVRQRTERLARLMDTAIGIPGTRFSFGLDALVGLFPVVGDIVGFVVGGWFLIEGSRVGAPPAVLGRMAGNIVLDALIGFVPVIGDIADIAFKANRRNARLLGEYLDSLEPPPQTAATVRVLQAPRSRPVVTALILGMLGLACYGAWQLAARWLGN